MKRRTGIEDWHPPAQPCRAVQGDRAYMRFIEMLVGFKCISLMVESTQQRPMQRRQNGAGDIDHRAMHLGDRADLREIFSRNHHR